MNKMKKVFIGFLITVTLVTVGCTYFLFKQVKGTANDMYHPMGSESKEDREEKMIQTSKGKPFSLLVIGVDERPGDKGRSDSLLLIGVNPNKDTIFLTSIPRDTQASIAGKNRNDKINHAYAYGGVDMTVKTVEQFFQVPVDYYVKINMEGFREIVDIFGGVEVQNNFSFKEQGISFPKGSLSLNGKEALAYARMRKQDPKGDLGRNERQREVMTSLLQKAFTVSALTKIDDILSSAGEHVKTNMTFDEMKHIQKIYRSDPPSIESIVIKGSGIRTNSSYQYVVEEEEKQRIATQFQQYLQFK